MRRDEKVRGRGMRAVPQRMAGMRGRVAKHPSLGDGSADDWSADDGRSTDDGYINEDGRSDDVSSAAKCAADSPAPQLLKLAVSAHQLSVFRGLQLPRTECTLHQISLKAQ